MATYCCRWSEVVWSGVSYDQDGLCGETLVDRVLTDVLRDRVDVVVKIEDLIIQNRLRWYGHVMRGDINSQLCEVMEVEITGKRKKGQPRKLWEECDIE